MENKTKKRKTIRFVSEYIIFGKCQRKYMMLQERHEITTRSVFSTGTKTDSVFYILKMKNVREVYWKIGKIATKLNAKKM